MFGKRLDDAWLQSWYMSFHHNHHICHRVMGTRPGLVSFNTYHTIYFVCACMATRSMNISYSALIQHHAC
jgi:hypothetical protein